MAKTCCNYIYVIDRLDKMEIQCLNEQGDPIISSNPYGDATIKVKYADGSIITFNGLILYGKIFFMNLKNYFEFPQMLSFTEQKIWKVAVYVDNELSFSFDLEPRR